MGDLATACQPKTLRILLADDSSISRALLRPTLQEVVEKEGYPRPEIVEVADGAEVLESLRSEEFDLLVLDFVLPVVDGAAVLTAVRSGERNPRLPIIAISCSPDDIERKALAAGATCFLFKPVTVARLVSALRQALVAGG